MAEAFVGLGSNVGDPGSNLRDAVRRLAAVVRIDAASSAYWTEPVGLREQPFFLNAVVRARADMSPRELLAVLKDIERTMGRRRDVPLGPRIIDLDLLLYDGLELDEPEITLPHPRMEERRFVLAPLAEIAPGVRPRKGGPTVAELLERLPEGESVERVELEGWPPDM